MSFRTIESITVAIFLLAAALAFHAWFVSHDEQQILQSTLAAQKRAIDDANSREQSRDAALNTTLAEIDKLKKATQSSQELVDQLQKYMALPEPIHLVDGSLSLSPQNDELAPPGQPKFSAGRSVQTTSTKGKPTTYSNVPSPPSTAIRTGSSVPFESPTIQIPSLPIQTQPNPAIAPSPSLLGEPSDLLDLRKLGFRDPGSSCDDLAQCYAELPGADLKPLFNYVQDCRACDAELAVAKQNASDDAAKIASLTHERDAAITVAKGGSFLRRLRHTLLWLSVGVALGYSASR